jgi:hypothetical protein
MGIAFGVALVLIYMLVVWEFKNFMVPVIVMAPIPLTLIGIIPGHWLMGAEFTATSMIGFIALAGIIVRNSLLLVDFARQEIAKGVPIVDAVIFSCQARTRPILITGAALVLGSSVILFDPIFQGMAVSLMFGVVVSTMLTLIVIPLGCVTARSAMCAAVASHEESPSVCSQPLQVNLHSPMHAGEIHVHPVHVPVAPESTLDQKPVEKKAESIDLDQEVAKVQNPHPSTESAAIVPPVTTATAVTPEPNEKPQSVDIVKHEQPVVAKNEEHTSPSEVHSVSENHDAVVVVQTASHVATPSVDHSVVDNIPQTVDNEAVKKKTRTPKKVKSMPVDDVQSVVTVATDASTTEAPTALTRPLSKRPRRGIRIKGVEET